MCNPVLGWSRSDGLREAANEAIGREVKICRHPVHAQVGLDHPQDEFAMSRVASGHRAWPCRPNMVEDFRPMCSSLAVDDRGLVDRACDWVVWIEIKDGNDGADFHRRRVKQTRRNHCDVSGPCFIGSERCGEGSPSPRSPRRFAPDRGNGLSASAPLKRSDRPFRYFLGPGQVCMQPSELASGAASTGLTSDRTMLRNAAEVKRCCGSSCPMRGAGLRFGGAPVAGTDFERPST